MQTHNSAKLPLWKNDPDDVVLFERLNWPGKLLMQISMWTKTFVKKLRQY